MRGVREGAIVQNVFTALKVGATVLLALAAFGSGTGSFAHCSPVFGASVGPKGAAMGVAMSQPLFAYDAWNTVTFVAGEVRERERSLPRALVAGTALTMLAYTVACAAYLYVLPVTSMAGVPENRIAANVASVVFGHMGVALVSVAILVSTIGCLNGLVLGGARVVFAMPRDELFCRFAGRVHPQRRTPSRALILQASWSAVLSLSGSYDRLLTYVTFASLAFNALTVHGRSVLRRTRSVVPSRLACPPVRTAAPRKYREHDLLTATFSIGTPCVCLGPRPFQQPLWRRCASSAAEATPQRIRRIARRTKPGSTTPAVTAATGRWKEDRSAVVA